jgi:hypothetical protein
MLAAIPAIIAAISGILNRIIPDPDKRLEAETEIQKALMQNQSAIYDAMKSVMAADAQSESWLTRNARPIVVMWCLAMITWVASGRHDQRDPRGAGRSLESRDGRHRRLYPGEIRHRRGEGGQKMNDDISEAEEFMARVDDRY